MIDLKYIECSQTEHKLQLSKLTLDYQAYIYPKVYADKYKLAISKGVVVGGYAYKFSGVVVGIFSLVSGLGVGKMIAKQAIKEVYEYTSTINIFLIGDYLRDFYNDLGFKITKVIPFDKKLASTNWNYERFGIPDLYEMAYNYDDTIKKHLYKWFGKVTTKVTNIEFYSIDINLSEILKVAKFYGLNIIEFSEFNKPNFAKYSYNTGHVFVYNPNNDEASFHDVDYTRKWRYVHELAHGLTYTKVLNEFNITKVIRGNGKVSLENAIIAMYWEIITLKRQYLILESLGVYITKFDKNLEINTLFADLLNRCITGNFLNPDLDCFKPKSYELITLKNYKQIITAIYKELVITK